MGRLLAALLLAASAQDRAELPKAVETWYRVVQGKRQVGYVHETLGWAGFPWRYQYSQESELELTLRGGSHPEDHTVSALLDETLSPLDLTLEAYAGDDLST